MALMSGRALLEIAKVYTYGATKYSADNWRGGIKWRRVMSAVQRHLVAWMDDEDLDQESGLPHLAHAAWGLIALLEYNYTHPELDDRYHGVA